MTSAVEAELSTTVPKKLKELGAEKVFLYVTHCENTILEGEVLSSGLIEKVYTTDSLLTTTHEKIEVMEL